MTRLYVDMIATRKDRNGFVDDIIYLTNEPSFSPGKSMGEILQTIILTAIEAQERGYEIEWNSSPTERFDDSVYVDKKFNKRWFQIAFSSRSGDFSISSNTGLMDFHNTTYIEALEAMINDAADLKSVFERVEWTTLEASDTDLAIFKERQ